MKDKIQLVILATTLAVCGLFTGCASTSQSVFRPTQWQTNQVPDAVVLVRTQRVDVVLTTNVIGQTLTNTVLVTVTNAVVVPAHAVVKPAAWEVNPGVTDIINTIGSATGPYGTVGALVLTTILGGIAQFRSRKYRNAAISIAQGVQQVVEAYPQQAGTIKNILSRAQNVDGTRGLVDRLRDEAVIEAPVTVTETPITRG